MAADPRKRQKKLERRKARRKAKKHQHVREEQTSFSRQPTDLNEDEEFGDDSEDGHSNFDEQVERIDAILGDSIDRSFDAAVKVFFDHLRASLQLPCEVTGIEDFRWEEFYVIGPGNQREYSRLRKDQPSYQDHYDLLDIELGIYSEWMLFGDEDIAAHVRRQSDSKEFVLGLAELKAVDKKSPNYQSLHDFAVFFVNYR